jgi:thymidylate synthase (FAD)
MQDLDEQKTRDFLKILVSLGHQSPFEHASFTFAIQGISRSLLAQITRHRIASFSVQSQRYVSEESFEYIIPPQIEAIEQAKEEFLKAMEQDRDFYNKLTQILQKNHKKALLSQKIDEKQAENLSKKMAIEDARFVLPNACNTKLICTFNARSLLHFFNLRLCNRAQWEIQNLATQMLKSVLAVAPNLFKNAGPPCFCGQCPEGKMSCGKQKQVHEFFKKLHNHSQK